MIEIGFQAIYLIQSYFPHPLQLMKKQHNILKAFCSPRCEVIQELLVLFSGWKHLALGPLPHNTAQAGTSSSAKHIILLDLF